MCLMISSMSDVNEPSANEILRLRCEYDGRVREYFDPLGAELLQGDAFYADEGPVGDFHVVFLGQFVERGLFDDSGPRLRN